MTISDIILLIGVFAGLAAAVVAIWRQRKRGGCSGCHGDCSGCGAPARAPRGKGRIPLSCRGECGSEKKS